MQTRLAGKRLFSGVILRQACPHFRTLWLVFLNQAKFLIDIPRIILGASFYALAVALFFPYRQGFASLYLLILGLYFVAFAMGYWISTAFPIAKSSLLGTGFALLWALVLSGVVPSLSDVSKLPARLQWLWDISAPRWAIEGFWLKEVEIRPWIEKLSSPSNLYVTGNYFVDVKNLFCIGLVWCVVALLGLKLFNRKKMK